MFDARLLPGGHAKGMRDYLESGLLQAHVAGPYALLGAVLGQRYDRTYAGQAGEPHGWRGVQRE